MCEVGQYCSVVVRAVDRFAGGTKKRARLGVPDDLDQAVVDRPGGTAGVASKESFVEAVGVDLNIGLRCMALAHGTFHGAPPYRLVKILKLSSIVAEFLPGAREKVHTFQRVVGLSRGYFLNHYFKSRALSGFCITGLDDCANTFHPFKGDAVRLLNAETLVLPTAV